ncbi:MAG: hypothetical protein AAF410_04185 [Pseudomonadota bacterium]
MQQNHFLILVVYAVLLLIGIPWYWPKSSTLVILGIPAWVLVSILVSLIVSIFTAYLLLTKSWSTDDPFDE